MPRLENLEDRTILSTLTVLNNHDSGAGSLRAAIAGAHSGDTIVFDPGLNGQTIALTSDELAIKKILDIEGPGADKLAVSGNDTFRVFDISQGLTVTIAGLTLTHGLGTGNLQDHSQGGGGGGALLNGGSTVNLANDIFSSNQAEHGGAITSVQGCCGNDPPPRPADPVRVRVTGSVRALIGGENLTGRFRLLVSGQLLKNSGIVPVGN